MAKISGLGRGLDAIFIDNETKSNDKKLMIRLSQIEPNKNQPRSDFDKTSLEELADSITQHGVLQPIIVRPSGEGFYKIIAGERRWRASKMAGLTEIPAIIVEADEKKAAEIALIENLQRENLNAIEEAMAYKSLTEEFGMTQEAIAKHIGKSRSAVANIMRLLELPDDVCKLVSNKTLSAGHARTLLALRRKEDINYAVQRITGRGLSVRSAEELIKTLNRKAMNDEKSIVAKSDSVSINYIKDLEDRLTENFGRRCRLSSRKGLNCLEIYYGGVSDLQDLITTICGADFADND